MKESSKAVMRRLGDSRFARRWFIGDGIDIGAGGDPLSLYAEFFPLMRSLRIWDQPDGDAQVMAGVPDAAFDFVHSSHCLEHLVDPREGLRNWLRILKPGGHLVMLVPDEDLYEQGQFPSTWNGDHKWTFTICKHRSWSKRSINILDMVREAAPTVQCLKIELLDSSFRYRLPRFDQTMTPVGESAIELVLRRRTVEEIQAGGLKFPPGQISPQAFQLLTGFKLG